MVKNEGHVLTQCDNGSTDCTVTVASYNLQQPRDKQVDCQILDKQWDKNLHINREMELVIPEQYSTFRDKFTKMLDQFKSIWDGSFRSIKAVRHRIELDKSASLPIHSALYQLTRGRERSKNDKSIEWSP